MTDFITMAHGNGGATMQELIRDYFVEAFDNPILSQGEDQARIVAVCGAVPKYLSCGFILEEGLPLETLKKLIQSMAKACQSAGIQVVTGDTKVVQKGAIDKVFINTAGIGVIPNGLDWGVHRIQPGDQIIVSGTLGDHGATILNLRENLGIQTDLRSDCAVLAPLIDCIRPIEGVKAVRDATRGTKSRDSN